MFEVAVLAVSPAGVRLARIISDETGADIHIFSKYAVPGATSFTKLSDHVQEIFPKYRGLIFVMAQGIVSRVTAPCLSSKKTDPAVVVCDDAGRYVISAAGGHEGGANELCCLVSSITGATPVITTSTQANRIYVAGVGTRRGISSNAVKEALTEACNEAGICVENLRLIASAWLKKEERGLIDAARELNVHIRFIPKFLFETYAGVYKPTAAAKYFDISAVAGPSAMIAAHNPAPALSAKVFGGVMIALAKDTLYG
ncbi:MAG: cobalamin biosynthesis protein [Deferribacteraceae bacterium]|jgi:cobalt-precorrin 5A hydrolase|nr:cobalamin biosynthesis protein [Deferribacteraceae bacterium]